VRSGAPEPVAAAISARAPNTAASRPVTTSTSDNGDLGPGERPPVPRSPTCSSCAGPPCLFGRDLRTVHGPGPGRKDGTEMRRLSLSLAAALAASLITALAGHGAAVASSKAPARTAPGSIGDFNGDGFADLAVGVPGDVV